MHLHYIYIYINAHACGWNCWPCPFTQAVFSWCADFHVDLSLLTNIGNFKCIYGRISDHYYWFLCAKLHVNFCMHLNRFRD